MFKPYCVAMTNKGYRVFPAEAFQHFWYIRHTSSATSFAALIESSQDEENFMKLCPGLSWCIRSARRHGYGK